MQGSSIEHLSSDQLAMERTRLAHERTLMAWVRTCTSLISFGFSIYKFFQYMVEQEGFLKPHRFFGPREFGIAMISIGVFGLLVATIQHRIYMKFLRKNYDKMPRSLSEILAVLILVFGFLLLIVVILRQ
jgi:putative membrane protein